jgi:hypothetical protein
VSDHLHLSLGNANTADTWNSITWTAAPFDAAGVTAPSPLCYFRCVLDEHPSNGSVIENCFVDIVRNRQQLLDRYYIQQAATQKWMSYNLAIKAMAILAGIQNGTDLGNPDLIRRCAHLTRFIRHRFWHFGFVYSCSRNVKQNNA